MGKKKRDFIFNQLVVFKKDIGSHKTILILLFFIVLAGIYFRTSGTLKGYFAFTFDQGRDLSVTATMFKTHKLRLLGPPTGIEGVFHGAWWYYLLLALYISGKRKSNGNCWIF